MTPPKLQRRVSPLPRFQNEIVETRYCAVRSQADEENTCVWKAIPCAKPPIGEVRWKATRDPDSHEAKVLELAGQFRAL